MILQARREGPGRETEAQRRARLGVGSWSLGARPGKGVSSYCADSDAKRVCLRKGGFTKARGRGSGSMKQPQGRFLGNSRQGNLQRPLTPVSRGAQSSVAAATPSTLPGSPPGTHTLPGLRRRPSAAGSEAPGAPWSQGARTVRAPPLASRGVRGCSARRRPAPARRD